VIDQLLRRKPRGMSYRGRATWRGVGDMWHLHFEPPLEIPAHSAANIDLTPPPPQGPAEFAVEIEFQRVPRNWAQVKQILAFALVFICSALCTYLLMRLTR